MISSSLKAVLGLACGLAIAAPVFAQPTAPAPAPKPMPHAVGTPHVATMKRMHMGHRFEGMSEEGQRILGEAMRPSKTPQEREAIRTARAKLLGLIAAEQLDVDAVRRAQAEERALVMRQHERKQDAMRAAYQKLSVSDRKAFVESMRDREERMADHLKVARERLEKMEQRMRERARERGTTGELEPILYRPIAG